MISDIVAKLPASMDHFPKSTRYDVTAPKDLWNLYIEFHYLLITFLEEFYEGSFDYSQGIDVIVRNLKICICKCEEALRIDQYCDRHKDFYAFEDLFEDSRKNPHARASREPDGALRFTGIPLDFTSPYYGIRADRSLWNARWKPKLLKHLKYAVESRLRFLPKMKKLEKKSEELFEETIKRYSGILRRLEDVEQYRLEGAGTRQHFRTRHMLVDRISYDPHAGVVYYGKDVASKPRKHSQEWLVWKLLNESEKPVQTATFEQMQSYATQQGRRLFRDIDDGITTLLSRWNRKFHRFGVVPLHKEGKSIVLSCRQKPSFNEPSVVRQ